VVGQPQFATVNALLAERLAQRGTLIVVHRGTASGSVVENTADAVTAAVASGGDVVEIDVSASTDGAFFAFHDGTEPRLLGIDANLTTLPTAKVRTLTYQNVHRGGRPARVEPLLGLLARFRGGPLFNIDRSWPWWPSLLSALDRLDMAGQLLLKCAADDEERVALLRAHPTKYPFIPICATLEQARRHLGDPILNTVGVELLATAPDSSFLDPAVIAGLQACGVLVLVNAEVLDNDVDLFAGHDDEVAVLDRPEHGWGPLFDLGVDAIQTDWPWLLRDYRERRRREAS
jgi:Domain of unknown function/Glycerophosphoryl diester phosphodiesterase family